MLYYAEHLKVTHRKDLAKKGLEAIWIQIKFPSNSALFSVMYRSELESQNFFEDVYEQLEKAWMKTSNIFLHDWWEVHGKTNQSEEITNFITTI